MRLSTRVLTVVLLASCVAPTACARDTISYVDRGETYSTTQLQTLLEDTSTDALAHKTRSEAPALRHDAMVRLRSLDGSASQAADMITRAFSSATASVPVYVEHATLEGADVLIVVEAWGKPSGRLSAKRLWAMDADSGQIRFSASVGSGR